MSSVRHDWYQTDLKVVIDVLVKNANKRYCTVDIQPKQVAIRGDDLELDLPLANEVDPTKSTFRISSVKIEITLQKLAGERWTSLVKKDDDIVTPKPVPIEPVQSVAFTTLKGKNWDRVVKDVCETEGIEKVSYFFLFVISICNFVCEYIFFVCVFIKDESKQLNGLFEKIYQDASPEVRRAMNKSFTESGMKKK